VTDFSNLRLKYLSLDAEVQGHIHAGLRSAPTSKVYKRWYEKRLVELQDARDKAREEWRKVAPPEPSYRDKLIMAANGHEDLESTKAARRLCDKKGFKYQ